MKKNFIIILAALFILIALPASANEDVVVRLQIDNPVMQINDIEAEIDSGRGTTPIVVNDRTLVPIRAIIEAFGGSVEWDGETRSVVLKMNDDKMVLGIDSTDAYFNEILYTLDVAPAVINDRTMLPIRFIAESFNLAVAWDNNTKTVYLIKNSLGNTEYEQLSLIEPYSGAAYVNVNESIPFFSAHEIIPASFEYYSELDELERCSVAMASVGVDIMPTDERESISSVIPTGWVNEEYEIVNGGYVYNRCHLIGFQLTGENANERNLITGTRYLNIEGMLPFENMIDNYVEQTNNHVIYRVTPFFRDDNLVAEGVLLEAYSVEDMGEGIKFCVYCYNVQPGININYQTGENSLAEIENAENEETVSVYRTPTGKKYHFDSECGGKNSFEITIEDAILNNLTPCSKCVTE